MVPVTIHYHLYGDYFWRFNIVSTDVNVIYVLESEAILIIKIRNFIGTICYGFDGNMIQGKGVAIDYYFIAVHILCMALNYVFILKENIMAIYLQVM